MSTPYGTSLVLFVNGYLVRDQYLVWDRTTSSVVTLCISHLWSAQIDVGVTVDVVHRFDTSLKFVAWVETDRLRDLSTFVSGVVGVYFGVGTIRVGVTISDIEGRYYPPHQLCV